MSNTSDTKTPPVHTVKVGNVKVAIWRNESGACNTTFERIYQDDGGNWQSSSSFGRDDLPKLELATKRAYAWIFDNNNRTWFFSGLGWCKSASVCPKQAFLYHLGDELFREFGDLTNVFHSLNNWRFSL